MQCVYIDMCFLCCENWVKKHEGRCNEIDGTQKLSQMAESLKSPHR